MEYVGRVERMRAMRNSYEMLVRKPEETKPLAKPMHTWEYNIKTDLKKTEGDGVHPALNNFSSCFVWL
jgi:hypothetical protein